MLLQMGLVALAYVVSGLLGLLLAIPPGYATAFWPPAGIGLAAVLLWGNRVAPGVFLGSFGLNLWISLSSGHGPRVADALLVALSIGGGAVLQSCGSARLIRRFSIFPNSLTKLRPICLFLVLGAFCGCLIGATWGVSTLWMAGVLSQDQLLFSWWTWWVGDMLGVLLLCPLMAASSVEQPNWQRRVVHVAGPTAVAFAVALTTFYAANQLEERHKRLDFTQRASELTQHLAMNFDMYLVELDALTRYLSNVPAIDRDEFRSFVQPAMDRHRGIQAFSWNVLVRDEGRSAYEASMRGAGMSGFQILEPSPQGELRTACAAPEYVPIELIEPLSANQSVRGMDVIRMPGRRPALERARDTGMATATELTTLVQRRDRSDAMLVYQPVYEMGRPQQSLEERRQHLRGYTTLVLLLGEVLQTASSSSYAPDISLSIEKVGADGDVESFFSSEPYAGVVASSNRLSYHHHFQLADQELILHAVPSRAFLLTVRSWQPWIVELGGLLFTSLLGIFLLFVTGQHARQEELVEERTSQLALAAGKLQAILDASTHAAIVATDTQGVITLFNTGAERLFGYTAAEVIGKQTPVIFHLTEELETYARWLRQECGFQEPGIQSIFAEVVAGRHKPRDWTFVRKDGTHVTANLLITPKRDQHGGIVGFVGVAHDVTEVRRANERFRVLFEQSSDAHLLFNGAGIIDCNEATVQMLGCQDKREVLGLHPAALSPEFQPDGQPSMLKCIEMDAIAHRCGYHRFDWTHRRHDGEEFLCEVTLTPVVLEGRPALLVVWHDLTERQRAQQALIESEERLRLSLDNSKQSIWDWNIVTGETFLDEHWCSMFDFEPGEFPDRIESMERIVHPDDLIRIQSVLRKHFEDANGVYNVDYRVRSKSGDWIWINACGRVCKRAPNGKPLRMIGTVQNITDRKSSEEVLARRAMELSRSNAELEQFAYVASHDLREPLRMVQSFCNLLQDGYADRLDERARTYIDFAVDGAARMQRLVDDLLEFSRVGRNNERLELVPLETVVKAAWGNLSAAIAESQATLKLDPLPMVCGDRGRLEQVFQNLFGNAIKFRGALAPAIRVGARQLEDDWQITVTDNGIGIQAEQIPQLFAIFQRLHTRDEYEGTGIGLALCKRIVEFHGGRIWLESETGVGTQVHFTATGIEDPSPHETQGALKASSRLTRHESPASSG